MSNFATPQIPSFPGGGAFSGPYGGMDSMTGGQMAVPYQGGGQYYNTGSSAYAGMFQNDPAMQGIMNAMPGFQSIRNPDGTLANNYAVGQAVDPNTVKSLYAPAQSSLAGLSAMASAPGMTAMGRQQDSMMSGAALTGARDAGQSALDHMAMQGGVSSGAGERLANQNMVNEAGAVSGAHNQAMLSDLGFKENLTAQLPSMYGQLAGSESNGLLSAANMNSANDRFNAANAIGDVGSLNSAMFGGWQTGANVYGNEQIAQAQLAAANKENPGLFGMGGTLGTGLGGDKGFLGSGLFSSHGVFGGSNVGVSPGNVGRGAGNIAKDGWDYTGGSKGLGQLY